MGIVDINGRAAFCISDYLQAARRTHKTGKRREHRARLFAEPDGEARRDQRVGSLEGAGQG